MDLRPHSVVGIVSLLLLLGISAPAADSMQDGDALFEKRVRPLLVEHCYECHSADSAESELRVDSLQGLLKGGVRGPALVLGDPDHSLMILAVNHADQLQMPPKSKLPSREIADLTTWVKLGAPWPGAEPSDSTNESATPSSATSPTTSTRLWSLQPLHATSPPQLPSDAQPRSPLDSYVQARLLAAGQTQAPAADRRVLIRRATFDLIGLPPTVDEVRTFLSDDAPDAFERLIDRLLASPRYGERWGRRWLDVARYADSNGLDENLAYANAFHYRDYVIRSFNADRPYDQFVRQQIAGDLTPGDDPEPDLERLTATGFLSLGAKMLAEDDPVKMQMDIVDEQIDTIGRAFMGLTIGCARCHDHKYDPIPTADYYSLAGIFKSTKTMENFKVVARWREVPLATPEDLRAADQHRAKIESATQAAERWQVQATETFLNEARDRAGAYLLAASRLLAVERLVAGLDTQGIAADGSPPGITLIEAENFSRGNVTRVKDGYGAGIGVITGPAGKNAVEFDVDVRTGNKYYVAVRYAAAEARPTRLFVNDQLLNGTVAREATGSWFPDTQKWSVEVAVPHDLGKSTIRLERDGPFPHIDKLALIEARSLQFHTSEDATDGDDGQTWPELVQPWARYLARAADDPHSVFAIWQARVSGRDVLPDTPSIARALEIDSVETLRAISLAELAGRYQDRFLRAQRAWSQLRSSEAGQSATALEDPADEAFRRVLYDPEGPFAAPPMIESHFPEDVALRLKQLRDEKTALEKSLPKFPEAMAVADDHPQNVRIHIRGSHVTLGEEVPRRFLRAIPGTTSTPIDASSSGRLPLARWLTSREHPLTARVMINRIWQGHFGNGLVTSPDNFGQLGDRPSHPELLDYVAERFAEDGWSIKAAHRLIMSSATYRASTTWNAAAAAVDPENRLLWRMNRQRLDAETLRDTLLALGDELDLAMGGSLLPTPNRAYVTSTANVNPMIYVSQRRSVYLPVVRSALYELFQAFDFADPSYLNGKRDTTTVAPQALFMMNSKVVAAQTRALAERLLAQDGLSDGQRVQLLFEHAYGRPAGDQEVQQALDYVARFTASAAVHAVAGEPHTSKAWQSLCRAILSSNELIYVE